MNIALRASLLALSSFAFFLSPAYAGAATLITDASIASHPVWTKAGAPYIVDGDLYVYTSLPALTIHAGVVVKFTPGSSIFVSENVVLNVEGTREEPVYFTSIKDDSLGGDTNGDGSATLPAPGDWSFAALVLNRGNVHVSHLKLRYGGAPDNPSVTGPISASLLLVSALNNTHRSIEMIEVSKSATVGVRAQTVFGGTLAISNSSFFDNAGYALERDRIPNHFGQFDLAGIIDARNNWWGDLSGPLHQTLNQNGLGGEIAPLADPSSQPINFDPWLTENPIPDPAPGAPDCVSDCFSNVLFLPGIEASRLYRPQVVGSIEKKLWEPYGDADALELAMHPNGTSVRDDIYTRDILANAYVPLKGNVYKSFIADMDELKVHEKIADWSATPYDWRLSLDDILSHGTQTGDNISYLTPTSTPYIIQELRRLASSSRTGKVTIIAHSNGGLVGKALLQKLGTTTSAQLIDKVIFVAVPQTGTPKAIGAILHGFEQALPVSWFPLALSPDTARTMARNMPSAYNLLTSHQYFAYTADPVIAFDDSTLLAPWRAKYGDTITTSERLRTFLADTSRPMLPTAEEIKDPIVGNDTLIQRAETLHNTELDAWTPPTGIRLIEIAGWGEDTMKTLRYYQGTAGTCAERRTDSTCAVITQTPVLDYTVDMTIDGDGTVVVPSALWTSGAERYWVDLKGYGASGFLSRTINREHADILEVDSLRTFIKDILTISTSTLPEFISTIQPATSPSDTRLRFTLHSPLTLDLYDDLGNHTGFSTTTNSLEENIPGSRYLSFGEVQYISVPSSANLNLIMDGYADGSFTFDIEEAQGDIVIATTTFSGIPSFTNTKVTMDIPENAGIEGASDLRMDVQGDGTIDVELEPKLNGVVVLPMPLTVTAEDKRITLGEPIPFLTAHISDAFDNAVLDDITGMPDCTTTATATSPAGEYPITCSLGTLSSEKYEFTTFVPGTLTVQYRWDGFLQPIKDTAHQVGQSASIFKGGSTIPVKFQLKDVNGRPVQASTAPLWYADSVASSAPYKWDSTAQQYVYNWSTKGLKTGYWYKISAQLDDGNIYYATVGLK